MNFTASFDSLDLAGILNNPEQVAWSSFQPSVEIYRLYGDGMTGPCAALLRFLPGGRIPLHRHLGYEHLYILSGSQTDERGTLVAGNFSINPPGTQHSVISENGCLVLAIYEKSVEFL